MSFRESLTLPVIKVLRKYFRNTWVHRLPITSWLYKKVFALTYSEAEKQVVFRGKKFLVYTKDTSMVPSIINQDYESFELDIYEKILRPGMTVLDIGANLGLYSVIGGNLVDPKGAIHAFEPVPENIKLLKHNIKLNNLKNVVVVPSAVGDTSGHVNMLLAKDNIGTHTIGAGLDSTISVRIDTIDNYVKRNKLKVGFIKMDIEGYEGHAISGALGVLKQQNVIMLTEFASGLIRQAGNDPKKIAKQLLDLYKYCYVIDERKKALLIVKSAQSIENLDNSNLLLSNTPVKI